MSQPGIILIADDERLGQETLAALLGPLGQQIIFASNGAEALDLAIARQPDLILLDVMMPQIDGFEFCRLARATPAIAEVPIIMVTALDDHESRLQGIEAGADDFVSKPFDRLELRARVRMILRLNRYGRLIHERKQVALLEQERRQIAYDLHDGLAQMLASTHQHLQAYGARHRPRAAQTRAELDTILDLARRSAAEIRRVIAGLRPTALDDFGLSAALRMHIEALHAKGLQISYDETLGREQLSPAVETALFRIAQEALNNVYKHASAERAAVALQRHEQGVSLHIQDWGCGFEPASVLAEASFGQQIGLRAMRERAALLGGSLWIESKPGAGTLVLADIPLRSNT